MATKQVYELYPFQKQGLYFIKERLKNNLGVILADEMGLGKTIQALYYLKGLYLVNTDKYLKTLIVAPKSVLNNWEEQLFKIFSDVKLDKFKLDIEVVTAKTKEFYMCHNIVIMNYEMLTKYKEKLMNYGFNIIICDEAHKLKNTSSLRYRAMNRLVVRLKKKNGKTIIITGTPILNYVIELYALLRFTVGEMTTKDVFSRRYCNKHVVKRFGRMYYDETGSSNEKELKRRLSDVMIRRFKRDVLPQLPKVVKQIIMFPKEKIKESKEKQQEIKNILKNINTFADVQKLKGCSRKDFDRFVELRQEQSIEKLPLCIDFIKEILNEKNKIVIFAHHRTVIEQLQEELKLYGCVTITGETSQTDRIKAISSFQNDSETKIFIGSMLAASEGITLTSANTCIFVEIDYTPAIVDQAIARLDRIGQKNSVNVYFLFQEQSIDTHILNIIRKKDKTIKNIFE